MAIYLSVNGMFDTDDLIRSYSKHNDFSMDFHDVTTFFVNDLSNEQILSMVMHVIAVVMGVSILVVLEKISVS